MTIWNIYSFETSSASRCYADAQHQQGANETSKKNGRSLIDADNKAIGDSLGRGEGFLRAAEQVTRWLLNCRSRAFW